MTGVKKPGDLNHLTKLYGNYVHNSTFCAWNPNVTGILAAKTR